MKQTLSELALRLAGGQITSRQLVESCLARIADPFGQGSRAFRSVYRDSALAAADYVDEQRRVGTVASPYAGIPICIKDNIDLCGEQTLAGSVMLEMTPPAQNDAPSVARLKAAGFVVLGRTNMTEFAYSGLGINPHLGTPLNPFERETGRVPGGSSSGAAVAIDDALAYGAIGTDTGGSCRIPAALCGVVGYKPTASLVSLEGVLPLSNTLDTVGPLANSVECCGILSGIMAGKSLATIEPANGQILRMLVPDLAYMDADDKVISDFEHSLKLLSDAGVHIERRSVAALKAVEVINADGGFAAYEAWAWHAARSFPKQFYDPRVRSRIDRGEAITADAYQRLHRQRRHFIQDIRQSMVGFDCLLMPTTPIVAPKLVSLEDNGAYLRANHLMLRNPGLVNVFDGCSISIPMHRSGHIPTGLMLSALGGHDIQLLRNARQVEGLLNKSRYRSVPDAGQ
jgi:aspartyl-tRNA(Asn)/glutamyl-tRNA(Gln) amidotransferase subunit A